ncbi:hypothetical protein [Paucibacter sp. Y2R2-4]|uniref:hypothetical protein n=1 Tax=Paucibacter sp. Y2R2-4 TaxID=2893553 RepID=UPI0021E480FA|nr:hypothetical protein [Paucibacter sp. Y2R2-4]MCV2351280.1 hypothetical protein [Paucibacter sp. Y2R2-4]
MSETRSGPRWAALCASGMAAWALIACGGGGGGGTDSNTSPPTNTKPAEPGPQLSGRVIDGYVRGATVWLDLNGNQKLDADEPSTISTTDGQYTLPLTPAQQDCLPYTVTYVDVPVGAIDQETGEVKQAYQMAIPPQLQTLAKDQSLHASPLTTVLWEELRNGLSKDPALNSCQALKQDKVLRDRLKNELDDTVKRLVTRHNLSAARIYADFVQSQDSAAHQLAVDIVRGLKAGFALRRQLQQQYADASYVRAEVYRGRGTSPHDRQGVWYRSHSVKVGGLMRTEKHELADDLSTMVRADYLRTVETRPLNNGSGNYTIYRIGYRSSVNTPSFRCNLYEGLDTSDKAGVGYELLTRYTRPQSLDAAAPCLSASSGEMDQVQGWDYYVRYSQDQVDYTTMISISPGSSGSSELQPWQRLADKLNTLDLAWLAPKLSSAGYRFDEAVTLPFDDWAKRAEDYRGLQIISEKFARDPWTRTSTQADGTSRKECSGDQGKTWGSCGG